MRRKRHGAWALVLAVGLAAGVLISAPAAWAQQPEAAHATAEAPAREWVGGSDLFGTPVFIQVELPAAPGRAAGRFTSLEWAAVNRPMTVETKPTGDVRFEFPSSTGVPFVGEGEVVGDVIRGTISRGQERGAFHLVPVAPVPLAVENAYVGTYQSSTRAEFLITPGGFGHLRIVQVGSAASAALLPSSPTKFFVGPAVISSTEPQQTVTFIEDPAGTVTGFVFRSGPSAPEVSARRVERYHQEQVTFRNGDVTLTGTLVSPERGGRYPVVVYHEGSGDWTRDGTWYSRPIDVFVKRRIAVFLYDKRGVGQSTGDWRTASYGELSGDLLAAVRALQSRPDIDRKRIGVRGFSQGGWIASLAAAKSQDVAFLIYNSASANGTVQAQDTASLLAKMRADGFTESDLFEAARLLELTYEAPHSPAAWARMQGAARVLSGRRWFRRTIAGLPRESWVWEQRRLNAGYDPAIAFERVRVPTLVVHGGLDQPEPGIRRIESALRRAGNQDFTIKVYAGADHNLEVEAKSGRAWAEGYLELLSDWTARRVCRGASSC